MFKRRFHRNRLRYGMIISLILCSHLLIFPSYVLNEVKRPPATITVDALKKTGPLPYIYRSGSYHWYIADPMAEKAFDKFLAEHKVGTIGIMLDTVLEPSKSYQDLVAGLSKWDPIVKKVVANGGEVFFEIWSTPLWLTTNPSLRVDEGSYESKNVAFESPPRDYEEWAKIIFAIVDHFNNGLKIDGKYQIWAEPELHWLGSEEEYLKLYRYSVKGARKADSKAKIGGPATAEWDSRFERVKGPLSEKPAIYNFIKYCSQTGLPELGISRLPIDFIVWHAYNLNPYSPFSYERPVNHIRKWLKDFGYPEKTELLIGEWNTWQVVGKDHPYYSPEHDTEFAASYIVASLDAMRRAGIGRQAFATLFDAEFGHNEPEYVGNFGMFTKNKIVKPSYNAFRAMGMLGADLIETEVDDDYIVAIGAREEKKITILISNFFPKDQMVGLGVFKRGSHKLPEIDEQRMRDALIHAGITKEKIEGLVSGKIPIEGLKISTEAKGDLEKMVSYLRKYRIEIKNEEWRTRDHIAVQAIFKNLPFQGEFRYQRYIIGSTHGNSYAVRARVAAAVKKGTASIQEINEWPEVRLTPAEDKKIKPVKEYNLNFDIEPYSVNVIVLSES